MRPYLGITSSLLGEDGLSGCINQRMIGYRAQIGGANFLLQFATSGFMLQTGDLITGLGFTDARRAA